MNKLRDILIRLFATFITYAVGVIAGSQWLAPDLELWKTMGMAGCGASINVIYRLAQAGRDGIWTNEEVDAAFDTPVKDDGTR